MNVLKEFKEFALKGNVVDMAIGIIIGTAFGKVISSMVGDVLMPPLGKILGGVNFSDLFINLNWNSPEKVASITQARQAGVAVIAYGQFMNTCLDFVIVAACMFAVVKGMSIMRRAQPETAPAAPETKQCPYCLSAVPAKATRCAHCTSGIG